MSFNLGNWWEKLNQDILRGGSGGDGGGDDDSGGGDSSDDDSSDDPEIDLTIDHRTYWPPLRGPDAPGVDFQHPISQDLSGSDESEPPRVQVPGGEETTPSWDQGREAEYEWQISWP